MISLSTPLLLIPMTLEYHYASTVKRLRTTVFTLRTPEMFSNHEAYLWHVGETLASATRHSGINKTHWISLVDAVGKVVVSIPGAMPLGH